MTELSTEQAFAALEAVQQHTTDPRIIEPLRLALVRLRELEAQSESQEPGPTDEDVVAACPFDSFHEPAEYHGWWSAIEWMEQRWGRPAVEPVPVSERTWEREGWCDTDGQCWMGDAGGRGFVPSWRLCKPSDSCLAWSLPHWALPVPKVNNTGKTND